MEQINTLSLFVTAGHLKILPALGGYFGTNRRRAAAMRQSVSRRRSGGRGSGPKSIAAPLFVLLGDFAADGVHVERARLLDDAFEPLRGQRARLREHDDF